MRDESSGQADPRTGLFLPGLAGTRVAVTAGANGIGLSIAKQLYVLGAKVAVCDIDAGALHRVGQDLPGCLAVEADVAGEQALGAFFDRVSDTFGGLDALVNNAGISGPTGPLEDLSTEDWCRCLDVCLTGQFLSARCAIPMIKASGGGAIVNMASVAAKHGYAYRTPYAAAKFGVIGLTQSLAKELGPERIRVNAVLPGIVEGPRMEGVIRERARANDLDYEVMKSIYLNNISMRRMVTAQDVAATVAFLLSDAGSNISGQSLAVDGNVETL